MKDGKVEIKAERAVEPAQRRERETYLLAQRDLTVKYSNIT